MNDWTTSRNRIKPNGYYPSNALLQRFVPGQPGLSRKFRHTLDLPGRPLPLDPHRRVVPGPSPLAGRPVGGVTPVLLDPPAPLVRVLEAHAGHHGDPAVPIEPHVLAEQLRLPLEALPVPDRAEVNPAVQQWPRREGDRAVPAAEDLERPAGREVGARFGVGGKEVV